MTQDLWKTFTRKAVGFNDIFEEVFNGIDDFSWQTTSNYPPYNLRKNSDSEHVLEFALAGWDIDEIDVSATKNGLSVKSINPRKGEPSKSYIHHGISKANFKSDFKLSEHTTVTEVYMKDGLLTIKLKTEKPEEKLDNVVNYKIVKV